MLELRFATFQDKDNLLLWRNHPDVRAVSFNLNEISSEEHARWLHEVLNDPDRILLIGCESGEPRGVVRLDMYNDNKTAEIHIYVVPGLMGKGNGKALLKAALEWTQNNSTVEKIIAKVIDSNLAAQKMFLSKGFEKRYLLFEKIINRP